MTTGRIWGKFFAVFENSMKKYFLAYNISLKYFLDKHTKVWFVSFQS